MKIILLQNVRKIGQKGEIVEVNDGYAHNFLFPQGLAKTATNAIIAQKKATKQKDEIAKKQMSTTLIDFFKSLANQDIIIEKPANKKGVLFSAVHIEDIVAAVQSKSKTKIPSDIFQHDINFKTIGIVDVPYTIDDYKGTLKIEIKAK